MNKIPSTQPLRGRTTPGSTGGSFRSAGKTDPESTLAAPVAAEPSPFVESNRRLRGHNFYPGVKMRDWPALYANDSVALDEVPFVAHYFVGGADWYISEVDQKTGEAFGYSDLGLGFGEYGYIDLPELERLIAKPSGFPQAVERELDFKPGTKAHEVIPKYARDKQVA